MLRAHRCRRYAARLKELIRCTPVDPLLLTEGEVTDLAFYTAVLCRSAGFTDCPEFEGFGRPALPKGADLGTLLVDFLYPESKNPGVWETPGFGVQDAAEFAAG